MALSIQIEPVTIQTDKTPMEGTLWLPEDPIGMILLADGRRGNRIKPPVDYVGSVLRNARLGTLWLDLLKPQEADSRQPCVEMEVLTRRLNSACDWLQNNGSTHDIPIGLFGAGNGAAAALQLAAMRRQGIFALVLRGGRPDLAAHGSLIKVNAPTLLIVGSLDDGMVGINRAAYAALRCKKRLEIIPGATHSFDEPGSLEVVARFARSWFLQNVRVRHV